LSTAANAINAAIGFHLNFNVIDNSSIMIIGIDDARMDIVREFLR